MIDVKGVLEKVVLLVFIFDKFFDKVWKKNDNVFRWFIICIINYKINNIWFG